MMMSTSFRQLLDDLIVYILMLEKSLHIFNTFQAASRMNYSIITKPLFYSCCFHSLLQLIFNLSINDHISDGFMLHIDEEHSRGIVDKGVRMMLSGYTRWDSQHFLFIAAKGYRLERSIAFMPLFPLLIRCFAELLNILTFQWLSFYSCLILAGLLVSNGSYILAGALLHRLTADVFKSWKMADVVLTLYMINPASIFFHTIYTESCYFLLVVFGLMIYRRAGKNKFATMKACAVFALSSLIRSNGLLNFGYIVHYLLSSAAIFFVEREKFKFTCLPILNLFTIGLGLVPFLALQYYMYQNFCSTATSGSYLLNIFSVFFGKRSERASFCVEFLLPYMAIQKKYWDVGFFQYFTLKRIPYFLLASPCLLLTFNACKFFWQSRRQNFLWFTFQRNGLAPHIIHCFFLALYCLFFVNVEISTRMMFSSSPLLLWYCAAQFGKLPSLQRMGLFSRVKILFDYGSFQARIILIYFVLYVFVGTLLHVNFYPWT